VTGSVLKAIRPESGGASPRRTSPAVWSTGSRAGEECKERPAPHRDPETSRLTRVGHFRAVLGLGLSRLLELVVGWNRRRRDWQLLAGLDERNLRDIGIDSTVVERDSAMSFWRLRLGLGPGSAADRRNAGRRGDYPAP
jgi:uncharacterized protein YjiS (DUF1127 family)